MSKPHCLPVAAIVLAAGSATRMGKVKQLLPYAGHTLVEHAVAQAMEAGFSPVIVVVGAEGEAVRASIASRPVEIVHNEAWRLGMGSSVTAGIRHLEKMGADSPAVAILVADQPLVKADQLAGMRELLHTSHAPAVAAQYDGTLGVPALFKRDLFAVLRELPPAAGARHLLRDSGLQVAAFPLPEAAIDIDTPQDFTALEASTSTS